MSDEKLTRRAAVEFAGSKAVREVPPAVTGPEGNLWYRSELESRAAARRKPAPRPPAVEVERRPDDAVGDLHRGVGE